MYVHVVCGSETIRERDSYTRSWQKYSAQNLDLSHHAYQPQNAILTVDVDIYARFYVVTGQHWHANTKVYLCAS